jgi:hypothetical protein
MYDHAPKRVYGPLDTCQMETYGHVRVPMVKCLALGKADRFGGRREQL